MRNYRVAWSVRKQVYKFNPMVSDRNQMPPMYVVQTPMAADNIVRLRSCFDGDKFYRKQILPPSSCM